jgi:hypothetical protein
MNQGALACRNEHHPTEELPMSFGRTVLFGAVLWVGGITLLYHFLNREETHDERVFRVGFLPVT